MSGENESLSSLPTSEEDSEAFHVYSTLPYVLPSVTAVGSNYWRNQAAHTIGVIPVEQTVTALAPHPHYPGHELRFMSKWNFVPFRLENPLGFPGSSSSMQAFYHAGDTSFFLSNVSSATPATPQYVTVRPEHDLGNPDLLGPNREIPPDFFDFLNSISARDYQAANIFHPHWYHPYPHVWEGQFQHPNMLHYPHHLGDYNAHHGMLMQPNMPPPNLTRLPNQHLGNVYPQHDMAMPPNVGMPIRNHPSEFVFQNPNTSRIIPPPNFRMLVPNRPRRVPTMTRAGGTGVFHALNPSPHPSTTQNPNMLTPNLPRLPYQHPGNVYSHHDMAMLPNVGLPTRNHPSEFGFQNPNTSRFPIMPPRNFRMLVPNRPGRVSTMTGAGSTDAMNPLNPSPYPSMTQTLSSSDGTVYSTAKPHGKDIDWGISSKPGSGSLGSHNLNISRYGESIKAPGNESGSFSNSETQAPDATSGNEDNQEGDQSIDYGRILISSEEKKTNAGIMKAEDSKSSSERLHKPTFQFDKLDVDLKTVEEDRSNFEGVLEIVSELCENSAIKEDNVPESEDSNVEVAQKAKDNT